MYKLQANGYIKRLSDGASVPNDEANSDYAAFLKWQAEGGVPEPYVPSIPVPPIDLSNMDNLDKVLKAVGLLLRQYTNALQAGTHTQKTVAQLKADFAAIYNSL